MLEPGETRCVLRQVEKLRVGFRSLVFGTGWGDRQKRKTDKKEDDPTVHKPKISNPLQKSNFAESALSSIFTAE